MFTNYFSPEYKINDNISDKIHFGYPYLLGDVKDLDISNYNRESIGYYAEKNQSF